LQANNKTI